MNYPTTPTSLDIETLTAQAITLAARLLEAAHQQQTSHEKKQANKIAGMMRDPQGKMMTMALSDQAFRSHSTARVNDQIRHLIDRYGIPSYFANWEQAALEIGTRIGRYIPQLVVPFVVAKLRAETSNVILPGEEDPLRTYLETRRADGTRLNLNYLGEAILGEDEAARRLDAYLDLLARPDVEYISIKISSIFSQINLAAIDYTLEKIKVRLRTLYRAAIQHNYVLPNGRSIPKFINLDMEEYGDLHVTVAAFQQVLEEPEFFHHRAGIVLQAYLPDSHAVQQTLTEWAKARHAQGGAAIKIRIVKGANLAMERVEASLHGWEQAPYYTKADVDANYKRMVLYGCRPENAVAANLGIASHNLFDIAFGLVVRESTGVETSVEFEMLEGMANHQARAVQTEADGLLLYAPVVKQDDFHSAIAYLVRRLDENTASENFLHDLFDLQVGNATWDRQAGFFQQSIARRDAIPAQPNRTQNRLTEQIVFTAMQAFHNEADTDFSLPENQAWIKSVVETWRAVTPEPVPLQIGGQFLRPNQAGVGVDPSRQTEAYVYALARPDHIEQALQTAVAAQEAWANRPIIQRKQLLIQVAEQLAKQRGNLIGAAILDAGKAVTQADVEVSEAIDFANYYARAFDMMTIEQLASYSPLGTVLIAPPWNFPIAIPAGGMLSALMAGNSVILKPAPETVLVDWQLINAFWDAGIPKEVLQFVPTTDDAVGQSLVTDERIDAVILTGAYETAQLFLGWKPELRLSAETSGKNSLIISAMADHDLAIKDLVHSAFGHNGQKCSAASLAVLEAEVYDNPIFLRQLKDAAASLTVGSAWELASKVTPLINEPNETLHRAQTTLDAGESWLLKPQMIDNNPRLWTPGIKLGVKAGSFYHQTECFGPVLGLMRADNLAQAIKLVNQSEFGLTSGLHSLDDREVAIWREQIEVGNAYVNRGTTGAIVQRQPFGGWKKSSFGTGAKAGGVNYVLSLGNWAGDDASADFRYDYQQAWQTHFSQEHDPSQLLGESNIFRYRPIRAMALRIENAVALALIKRVVLAAELCAVPLTISVAPELDGVFSAELPIKTETAAQFIQSLSRYERVRLFGTASRPLLRAAHKLHVPILSDPVSRFGRIELRHYLREQAISETTHRYGNVQGKRGGNKE
ncbi:MAG: proline dehydrogenase family protein [Candidatus Promineifilaceae bacterium]